MSILLFDCSDGFAAGEAVPNQLAEFLPRQSGFDPELLHLDVELRPADKASVFVFAVRARVHGCIMDFSLIACQARSSFFSRTLAGHIDTVGFEVFSVYEKGLNHLGCPAPGSA
jgi:hypothetical protein